LEDKSAKPSKIKARYSLIPATVMTLTEQHERPSLQLKRPGC